MTDSDMQDLKAIKEKYKARLLALPNVEAVGIGPQMSNGQSTGKLALKVFVRKKVPAAELTEDNVIPRELDGFPTDVQELAPLYIHQPK